MSNNDLQQKDVAAVAEQQGTFKREIGVFTGSNILIGIMVGSGIFYIGSYVLQRSGMSMGFALLAWLVGGIVTMLGAICFAELGAMIPKAGGLYVYLEQAYSPALGFMQKFTSIVLSGAGSIAAVAIAFPMALRTLFEINETTAKIIACITILVFTLINWLGVKLGSIMQNIFTVAKLIPLVLIIVLGIFWGKEAPVLTELNPTGANFFGLVRMMAFAVIATLWAYEGWTNLNSVGEEMKNPQKNMPRAIILAVGFCTVLYVLFNFAIYRVIPIGQIDTLINAAEPQLYLGTEVAKVFLGSAGAILVAVTMSISMVGCVNGMILAFPREYYAVAKAGYFFKSVGKLHPKYNTPGVSLWMQCVISMVLVWLRNLDQLTSMVVFAGALFNVLTILAVPILRKKYPQLKRPYKVWGYPVTLVLAVLAFTGILVNNLFDDPVTSIIGLVVPAIGFLLYLVFKKMYNPDPPKFEIDSEGNPII